MVVHSSEVSWSLVNSSGVVVLTGGVTFGALSLKTYVYQGLLYSWHGWPGDGWNGYFSITMSCPNSYSNYWSTDLLIFSWALCPVLGCTDATATNYDPLANTDDSSPVLVLLLLTVKTLI